MKNKIILGTIIGTFLIASAGCSNTKTLTCTSESQESGAKLTQQVLVTFDKNDTLSHVKITTKIDAEDVREKCEQTFWFITGLAIATALCLLIAGIFIWLLFKAFNLFAILVMEV